jgi:hypothetical protein
MEQSGLPTQSAHWRLDPDHRQNQQRRRGPRTQTQGTGREPVQVTIRSHQRPSRLPARLQRQPSGAAADTRAPPCLRRRPPRPVARQKPPGRAEPLGVHATLPWHTAKGRVMPTGSCLLVIFYRCTSIHACPPPRAAQRFPASYGGAPFSVKSHGRVENVSALRGWKGSARAMLRGRTVPTGYSC